MATMTFRAKSRNCGIIINEIVRKGPNGEPRAEYTQDVKEVSSSKAEVTLTFPGEIPSFVARRIRTFVAQRTIFQVDGAH